MISSQVSISHDTVHLHASVHAPIHHSAVFIISFLDDPERLTSHSGPARLEPHLLDVCDLFIETLIFKSVCIHLCLVILELSNHVLELLCALLQVLLIHLQLFGDLGP